ncbi:STAS domain-containing protein [Thiomicrorhabdus arctica]|jgi:ABC-type transporter Mla MlaB component|uniref:STAS domain-containing protein n=1 Tax=Thiomicrorhabdus arctica TaxID=131540 RepID=UPI00037F82B4|nr:STAS domain-containing protein [Thiomicrorhabdus arctica]
MSELMWSEASGLMALPVEVTLQTLPQLLKSKAVLNYPVLEVDFSEVKLVDSAALALLLVWAGNTATALKVKNIPSELHTLTTLYDLETVLGLPE